MVLLSMDMVIRKFQDTRIHTCIEPVELVQFLNFCRNVGLDRTLRSIFQATRIYPVYVFLCREEKVTREFGQHIGQSSVPCLTPYDLIMSDKK